MKDPMPHSLYGAVLLIGISASLASSALAQPSSPPKTRIELASSPAVDLHFYIRAMAERSRDSWTPELAGAAEAVKKLQEKLGGGLLAWGPIEGQLYGIKTGADLGELFSRLSEAKTGPHGDRIPWGEAAGAYGRALVDAEKFFLEKVWPGHEKIIRERTIEIERDLLSKQGECIDFMLNHLGIVDPKAMVPVFLVADAPFPGAFTFRRRGGLGVCYVSCTDQHHRQSLLYEQVLHEATHAFDLASGGKSVFGQLRDRLTAAGVSQTDRNLRDVPHTVMFVQAAETIRRLIDPNHKHYGHVAGYYDKVPAATAAVYEPWIDYLDEKIGRDEAMDRMVARTVNADSKSRD